MNIWVSSFAAMFSVLNPISATVVFSTLSSGLDKHKARVAATKAIFTAFVATTLSIFFGQLIFAFFGFTPLALRLAGGILIFYRAMGMLYGDEDPEEHTSGEEQAELNTGADFAIIPFGIPMLAGPGTLSTVMGLVVQSTFITKLIVLAVVIINLGICYACLLHANFITSKLGAKGTHVVTKLMGLILAAVAVQFLLGGIKTYVFQLHAELH